MTIDEVEVFVGSVLAGLLSIVCVAIFARMVLSSDEERSGLMVLLGVTMLAGVLLVGDAPVVSLVVNSVVAVGCLHALYWAATKESPKTFVVGVLAVSMISSLLLSEASRSYEFSLFKWVELQASGSAAHSSEVRNFAARFYGMFDQYSRNGVGRLFGVVAWFLGSASCSYILAVLMWAAIRDPEFRRQFFRSADGRTIHSITAIATLWLVMALIYCGFVYITWRSLLAVIEEVG